MCGFAAYDLHSAEKREKCEVQSHPCVKKLGSLNLREKIKTAALLITMETEALTIPEQRAWGPRCAPIVHASFINTVDFMLNDAALLFLALNVETLCCDRDLPMSNSQTEGGIIILKAKHNFKVKKIHRVQCVDKVKTSLY
ncbi:hypothetical protein NL108_005871 [Boleophthalmus pectinirostris]|nr:hypothetical protein NL108_005871 [Boleophthalmus pectinirostris]